MKIQIKDLKVGDTCKGTESYMYKTKIYTVFEKIKDRVEAGMTKQSTILFLGNTLVTKLN
jgi:hypothetical protein